MLARPPAAPSAERGRAGRGGRPAGAAVVPGWREAPGPTWQPSAGGSGCPSPDEPRSRRPLPCSRPRLQLFWCQTEEAGPGLVAAAVTSCQWEDRLASCPLTLSGLCAQRHGGHRSRGALSQVSIRSPQPCSAHRPPARPGPRCGRDSLEQRNPDGSGSGTASRPTGPLRTALSSSSPCHSSVPGTGRGGPSPRAHGLAVLVGPEKARGWDLLRWWHRRGRRVTSQGAWKEGGWGGGEGVWDALGKAAAGEGPAGQEADRPSRRADSPARPRSGAGRAGGGRRPRARGTAAPLPPPAAPGRCPPRAPVTERQRPYRGWVAPARPPAPAQNHRSLQGAAGASGAARGSGAGRRRRADGDTNSAERVQHKISFPAPTTSRD